MPISAVQSFSNCINPEIGCYFAKSGKTWAVHILGHWCYTVSQIQYQNICWRLITCYTFLSTSLPAQNESKKQCVEIYWGFFMSQTPEWLKLPQTFIVEPRKLTVFGKVWSTGLLISFLFQSFDPVKKLKDFFKVYTFIFISPSGSI